MLVIIVALIGMWTIPGSVGVGPTRSDCQRSCGNVTIPYPFGIQGQEGCYWDDGAAPMSSFIVSCEQVNGRQSIFMWNSTYTFEMLDISVDNHEIRALGDVATDCYSSSGNNTSHEVAELGLPRFPISSSRNTLMAVGCDTFPISVGTSGVIANGTSTTNDGVYAIGCISFCGSISGITNGTCAGMGCCQTDDIPKNVTNYQLSIFSSSNHSLVHSFNPCSYAFIAETGYFNFSTQYLYNMEETRMPIIIDWSIGNQTCDEARSSPTSYMCADNTDCTDAQNGSGYMCHCSLGYNGNPYLPNGCQDTDECVTIQPCITKCVNLVGTYNCTACPTGFRGDGRKNGTGCSPIQRQHKSSPGDYVLGISIGFLILVLCVSWIYWAFRQRSAKKERKRFFKENGGLMLQQLLFEHATSVETLKVFSEEELKKATNNYHESRILGEGGQGTVYKGSVLNDRVVAIKKAKIIDRSQVKDFINEVIVLSQINHKNVVKLVGCCLETEYPLLVYEFVTNGTLYSHIHKSSSSSSSTLSWMQRLRIAAETAGALSYLHYDMSLQIIHRDIKSTNILLDENNVAKISDFGASRLVPVDQTELNTLVQGTLGYLDPEYFHSSQLTEKSDVYSFGVVLAELITGLKALSFERAEKDRNLSLYLVSAIKEDRLLEVIDKEIMNDENSKEIMEVGLVASTCLRVRGEDRPTMKEVAMKLEGLIGATRRHPWTREEEGADDREEKEVLLGEFSASDYTDSVSKLAPIELEEGR